MKNRSYLLLITLLITTCAFLSPPEIEEPHPTPPVNLNQFTDDRDGQVYKTANLAGQTWMTENLNYQTSDSWCYENQLANCNKMGRLYTWHSAQNACPDGWHLPNNQEWRNLLDHLGGYVVGQTDSIVGDPKEGFDMGVQNFNLGLSGARFPDNSFTGMGTSAAFWTSDDFAENKAAGNNVTFSSQSHIAIFNGTLMYIKEGGYACRCVQGVIEKD